MLSKAVIRKRGQAFRRSLTPAQRLQLDEQILKRCHTQLNWPTYQQIHLFLPIPAQLEINTWPLLAWVWHHYPEVRTVVPRVRGEQLEQVLVVPETKFLPSRLGIPEPTSGDILPDGIPLDVIFVPLLGFDLAGQRVGYGGGFYDRFLANLPGALKVGLAYEGLRVDTGIPSKPHDVCLDMVITEQREYHFKGIS